MKQIATDLLEIAYLDDGPHDAPVALLLHGWPDDPLGLSTLADRLRRCGYRTIIPWLRGFGRTRFLSDATVRDGRGVALAQDAIDLLDRLSISRCLIIGHDWGGRAGYHLAALVPERLTALVALGIGYAPQGRFQMPPFAQARLWWYQWLMSTEGGAARVRDDPIGFAREQWETWSPQGWFEASDFVRTAESFCSPDWVDITLHGYRSRWIKAVPVDARYAEAQAKIEATSDLVVPTMIIVGREDKADFPEESDGKASFFKAAFSRRVLEGVGHFPAREAPDAVANSIADFLRNNVDRSGLDPSTPKVVLRNRPA